MMTMPRYQAYLVNVCFGLQACEASLEVAESIGPYTTYTKLGFYFTSQEVG